MTNNPNYEFSRHRSFAYARVVVLPPSGIHLQPLCISSRTTNELEEQTDERRKLTLLPK